MLATWRAAGDQQAIIIRSLAESALGTTQPMNFAVHSIITIMSDLGSAVHCGPGSGHHHSTDYRCFERISILAAPCHKIVGITSQQHLQGLGSARQPPIRP